MDDDNVRRLYLKAGDRVVHLQFPEWGAGVVTQEGNSMLAGGLSFVRILFKDGQIRVFDNNFDNACCCYYSGIRKCSEV